MMGAGNHFVTVIPFFPSKREFGMIREYAQGPNAMIMSVACGGYEASQAWRKMHMCKLFATSDKSDLRAIAHSFGQIDRYCKQA